MDIEERVTRLEEQLSAQKRAQVVIGIMAFIALIVSLALFFFA